MYSISENPGAFAHGEFPQERRDSAYSEQRETREHRGYGERRPHGQHPAFDERRIERAQDAHGEHTLQGEHGGHRGHGNGDNLLESLFAKAPDAQLLFVGSVNCLRHKPYMGIGKLMQAGKASVLCPTMTDFSTGRYLRQITDAIVELSQERNCRRFILSFGCQWVILSTDEDVIRRELQEDYGIELIIHDDSHLEFGDHQ